MNIQGSFPLGRTGWISLQSRGVCSLSPSKIEEKARVREASSLPGGDSISFFVIHENDMTNLPESFPKRLVPILSQYSQSKPFEEAKCCPTEALTLWQEQAARSVTSGGAEPPTAQARCCVAAPAAAGSPALPIPRLPRPTPDARHCASFGLCTVGAGFRFLPLSQGQGAGD